ncbi:MAG: DUF4166 domain-containing protein [Alphaproteobacteria bacterium]|nr:MAG: DUF4166 domain-containing protein [Alphaproteobacteria bacterium]
MSEAALFKSQLGDDWDKIDPNIQTRFNADPAPGRPIIYKGKMTVLRRSWLGWLIAKLTFFTDGAFCAWNGTDIEADIEVFKKDGSEDIHKIRRYYFPDKKKTYIFKSHMHLNEQGELLEFVGAGLGMVVKVQEKNHALFFTDGGCFFHIGTYRVSMPSFLTLGKIKLTHTNTGKNRFKIVIDITHPLFGQLFYQEGVFEDTPPPAAI